MCKVRQWNNMTKRITYIFHIKKLDPVLIPQKLKLVSLRNPQTNYDEQRQTTRYWQLYLLLMNSLPLLTTYYSTMD